METLFTKPVTCFTCVNSYKRDLP